MASTRNKTTLPKPTPPFDTIAQVAGEGDSAHLSYNDEMSDFARGAVRTTEARVVRAWGEQRDSAWEEPVSTMGMSWGRRREEQGAEQMRRSREGRGG